MEAMRADWNGAAETVLRVDGGMVASDWTMQAIADQLDAPVDRPMIIETTALGAAYLAGFAVGICPAPQEFSKAWKLEKRFAPTLGDEARQQFYRGWKSAVSRTLGRL